jgi:acetylornithine deacetylase
MDVFELTRSLVDIESVTGHEGRVVEFLAQRLEPLLGSTGTLNRQPVAADRFNLFASWGHPEVVLSTHLDTVPPFFPARVEGTRLYGRGACDAKGSAAAMVCAVANLLAEGRQGFGLLFVVGEETDSVGAMRANETPVGSRFLVGGEPTENRLAVGTKGALYLELVAAGKTAHSAYPELGDSAIERLLDALARLKAVPLPSSPVLGATTLNVGTLEGGRAANVVADHARSEVMLRTVADTVELKRQLTAAIESAGVRVAAVRETPALRLKVLPGFATELMRYTTDLPRLSEWGEPLLLGPGSISVAHTQEEFVEAADLNEAVTLYAQVVRELQSGMAEKKSSTTPR